jgi:cytoskeleton protein RodZ
MADIGPTLREARLRARIDITEVETKTKIRAKYLRAIENEEWDLLPGPVYIKSFLRTYGDFLGLDSRMLVDEFRRRYERPSDHDLRPMPSVVRERERAARGPLVPPWLLIGLVLVVVAGALYAVGSLGSSSKPTTTPTATHPPANHNHPPHHRAPGTKSDTVKLQLVPTGTLYVCLVNGKGKQLIPGKIFNLGETIPTETAHKLRLTLGNNAVDMKVNGVHIPVGPSSNSIGFLLTPTAHKSLPLSQQPSCK